MNPAERFHRLKLLEIALKRALPAAAAEAEAYRESVSAKTLELDHGTLTVVRPAPAIAVDPEGLLAWVREHRPDELVPRVRESFVEAFTKSLTVVDGEVVDGDGTVVEFATVVRRRPYLTTRFADDAKDQAAAEVAAALESWTAREVER